MFTILSYTGLSSVFTESEDFYNDLEKLNPNAIVYTDSGTCTVQEYNQRQQEIAIVDKGKSDQQFFAICFGIFFGIFIFSLSISLFFWKMKKKREQKEQEEYMKRVYAANESVRQAVKEKEKIRAAFKEQTDQVAIEEQVVKETQIAIKKQSDQDTIEDLDVPAVPVGGLEENSYDAKVISLLEDIGCTVSFLGPSKSISPEKLTAIYKTESERGMENGYATVVVELDNIFADNLFIEYDDYTGHDLKAYIQEKLASPLLDAEDILSNRLEEIKETYADVDWDNDIVKSRLDRTFVLDTITLCDNSTDNLAIVSVPIGDVDKIYDLFCYLPFGGPESPAPMKQRSIARYWHEKYGVIPCFISGDVLQYYVPKPINKSQTGELALQQLSFCVDIIVQNEIGVEDLAAGLEKSNYWYFWWD